ncbi:GAP family protein [Dietzia timorensis]|uniref:GAP family protein n=1 Tax=Dietzia timorensis TaxID=499555 RepID=UPI001E3AD6D2|nr:GAP family protein [Dietzia timorensis]
MGEQMEVPLVVFGHILQLMGLAAVDSVNLLAFAVIAGLWLSLRDKPGLFAPRAAQFTGGAFIGIMILAALAVWVIGANQDFLRELWENPIVAVIAGIIGVILLAVAFKPQKNKRAEHAAAKLADSRREGYEVAAEQAVDEALAEDSPIPKSVLQKFGLFGTGIALGIIQSGTSIPFATGVVVISFAGTSVLQQIIEIVVFALVAIAPSACLITVLSKVNSSRVDAATSKINRFLARAKTLGKWLTIAVGVALVILSIVRMLQLGVLF